MYIVCIPCIYRVTWILWDYIVQRYLLRIFTYKYILDEDKLKWAFKLYDVDSNGVIDVKEMTAIIETLDCIEGVKPG